MDLRQVSYVAERYLEALDTPVSLSVYLMLKYREWDQIAVKRTDPRTYTAQMGRRFRGDYLATELLRKFPGLPLKNVDRVKAAKDAFWLSEHECAKTNVRLHPYVNDPLSEDCETHVTQFIKQVRGVIARILGKLPPTLDIRFGPGATFESRVSLARSNLTLGDKLELGLHCTASCAPLLGLVYQTAWGRAMVRRFPDRSAPTFVRSNRYFTVPKDATIERGACAEPGVNVALQLAVGRVMRSRLLAEGLDLTEGQAVHGRRALAASLSGDDVTIDLQRASDTNCRLLPKLLLPDDWFQLLSMLRSPSTEIDGRTVWLEKFSSMGNGFTFELETLIFYAICKVATELSSPEYSRVDVFGDDIIVPTHSATNCLAALRFFGFTPNMRKTFTVGHFRESCGEDAFNGVSTKAFRWDSEPSEPADWISVHNGIYRAIGDLKGSRSAMNACRAQIPREVRACNGPERYGDIVLHGLPRERWIVRRSPECDQIEEVRVFRPVNSLVSLDHFVPEMQYALALYGASSEGLGHRKNGSDSVSGYRFDWLSVS